MERKGIARAIAAETKVMNKNPNPREETAAGCVFEGR